MQLAGNVGAFPIPGGNLILVVGHEALAAIPAVRLLDEAGAIVAASPIESRVDLGVMQDSPVVGPDGSDHPCRTVADHRDLAIPVELPELTAAPVFQRAVLLQAGLVGDGFIGRKRG